MSIFGTDNNYKVVVCFITYIRSMFTYSLPHQHFIYLNDIHEYLHSYCVVGIRVTCASHTHIIPYYTLAFGSKSDIVQDTIKGQNIHNRSWVPERHAPRVNFNHKQPDSKSAYTP